VTLPSFIVIGVAKGGTTSLYRYFDQHPQVYMHPDKGTNFFGWEDARNWQWWDEGDAPRGLHHFKAKTLEEFEAAFAGATDELAVGEVSPQYLRSPTAAQRMRETLPDVQVIASLRNPAERAFSGFLMRTRRGEPVQTAYEELTPTASHVKEGFYYTRLKRYFDEFPRQQLKIFLFDDFRRDPAKMMAELFGFVGVDASFVPDTTSKHNPANVPKSRLANRVLYHPRVIRTAKTVIPLPAYGLAKRARQLALKEPPTLPDDLRARLLEIYREDILKLEALLERDLSVWLAPA
jgi:hypothetical protein